ncbi:translation initiation factor IF-2 [Streptomyces sp. NPDC088923]|uniref:translation initiation factor IF-2 n=1 Tax=Streptomyces sp. NPDC088923 TaxID=3365913 RepID=UPI00380E5939
MTAILPDKATTTGSGDYAATSFLPADARERLEPKLREAVSEFVDSPAEAVEKADRLLAEIVEQLHEALVHRHGELRSAWDGKAGAKSARSTGSTERTRHDDGAGFGDGKGFGDGTPSGAATGLRNDRADLTGDRADLSGDRADLSGDRADLTGDRDRTGTARDADRDGTADDRAGLAGAASARKPGATTGTETGTTTGATAGTETEAGTRVPGEERTASRPGHGTEADTERLRLALQEYRETTERLLSL